MQMSPPLMLAEPDPFPEPLFDLVGERSDALEQALREGQADNFYNLLYQVPRLYSAFISPNLSLIFAPSNDALTRLAQNTGLTLQQLSSNLAAIDILANHISISPVEKTYPIVIFINGQAYNAEDQYLAMMRPKFTRKIGNVLVSVIDSVITYPGQLNQIKIQRDAGVFGILNYDNFINLVKLGGLRGRDLIGFCLSNSAIDVMCDRIDRNGLSIFHHLILEQYGIRVDPARNPRDQRAVREMYITLSNGHQAHTVISTTADHAVGGGYFRSVPRPLPGFNYVKQVSCGHTATFLLDVLGNTYVMGSIHESPNSLRRLGPVPIKLDFHNPRHIVKISAAASYCLFLDSRKQVFGMGYNNFNQLGLGHYPTVYVESPTFIPSGGSNIVDIAAAYRNAIFLTADGQVGITGLNANWVRHEIYGLPSYSVPVANNVERIFAADDSIGFIQRVGLRREFWLRIDGKDYQIFDDSLSPLANLRDGAVGDGGYAFIDGTGQLWVRKLQRKGRVINFLSVFADHRNDAFMGLLKYAQEPELRFVQVMLHKFNGWVLSEDGRVFKFGLKSPAFPHEGGALFTYSLGSYLELVKDTRWIKKVYQMANGGAPSKNFAYLTD